MTLVYNVTDFMEHILQLFEEKFLN